MGTTTKPRRRFRPRQEVANPIAIAMRRARKIPLEEIAEVMAPIATSFRAMREGVGQEDHWRMLAGSIELAIAIEDQGVIKGLQGHLKEAETALREIARRARAGGEWRATPLYWQEIEHLDTFVDVHRIQLEQLSEGEWRKAHTLAVGRVISAGGAAFGLEDLNLQQPLPLA